MECFEITEETTREEIIERVRELEAELEAGVIRLDEAADLMAELGRIHNTPYAKAEWTAGR